jgi:hypothetical protein
VGRFGGKGSKERLLTSREERLVKEVFRTARLPPFSQITIADGVNFHGGAWTDSDYQINVGPDLYERDMATAAAGTLVHEMTHVWQYHNGTLTKAHGFGAHLRASLGGYDDELYSYDLAGSWDDMGFEGQAQMVEDWHEMGMTTEGYRYFFMKHVVWARNRAAGRLSRAELAQLEPDVGAAENVSFPDAAIAHVESVPLTDAYLISLLKPRYASDDVAGYGARARTLEQVFRSATPAQASALATRIASRNAVDNVSRYFHDHLSTLTRTKLLQIARNRAAGR